MTTDHKITPDDAERHEIQATLTALLLYAVRGDCDASMQLLRLTNQTTVNLTTHHLAHVLGNLVIAELGREHAELNVRGLVEQIAGGAR